MSKRIITHLSHVDVNMGALIKAWGPYRLIVEVDCHPFQSLARAIAHQQLNGVAANTILRRFVSSCGNGVFPTPETVLATPVETLRAAGLSFAKIASLKDLAGKTLEGIVPERQALIELQDVEIIERLTQVRGIGRWTVEMLLMFQLGRPDVLPVDDFGVRNGFRLAYGMRKMPAPRALAAFGERWAPHRTAAAWYLWRANDLKRAGTLPAPLERVRLPRLRRLRKIVRNTKAQVRTIRRRLARK
ncbi:MAG: DNA-3-methyladenine glycosylase family protein [Steroidobacteraceae bacterium]